MNICYLREGTSKNQFKLTENSSEVFSEFCCRFSVILLYPQTKVGDILDSGPLLLTP